MKRPLAVIGFSFFLTLAVLQQIERTAVSVGFGIAMLLLFVVSMLFPRTREERVFPTAALAALSACAFLLSMTLCVYQPIVSLAGTAAVKGQVVSLPEEYNGTYRYVLKTSEINGAKQKIRLRFSTTALPDLHPYDTLEFTGKLYVPGDGDEENAKRWRANGVYLGAYAVRDVAITEATTQPLYGHILHFRRTLTASVQRRLPGDEGKVVCAMLFGDTYGVPDEIYGNFKAAGVAHLFAVSGLHLSIWAYGVFRLLRLLRCRPRFCASVTILFVIFFTALTGFPYSCVRAAVMMLLMLFAVLLDEEAETLNSIGAALLVICLRNPFAAYSVSLQLSVSAILGLVLFAPKLYAAFRVGRIRRRGLRRIASAAAGAFSASTAALLFTLPVCFLSIGSVSLVAPLTNVALSFPSYLLMWSGGLTALTGCLPALQTPVGWIASLLAKLVIRVAAWFAAIPFACVSAKERFVQAWLIVTCLFVAAAILRYCRNGAWKLRVTALLSAGILLCGVVTFYFVDRDRIKITVLDVGDGLSVLVQKKDYNMLIGCSGDYRADNVLRQSLTDARVDHLDLLVLARNADIQTGALPRLLRSYPDAAVLCMDPAWSKAAVLGNAQAATAVPEETKVASDLSLCAVTDGELHYLRLSVRGMTVLIRVEPSADIPTQTTVTSADLLIARGSLPRTAEDRQFRYIVLSDGASQRLDEVNMINIHGKRAAATCGYGSIRICLRDDIESVRRL